MATDGEYGGYKYKFVDGEPRKVLKCSMCQLVVRDPHQITCCSNRLCKSCLDRLIPTGIARAFKKVNCPLCQKPMNRYFKDGGINREIIALKVYCTNSEEGCKWQGTINETDDTSIDTHLNSCPYQQVPCTNECGAMVRRGELKTHLTDKCHKRIAHCQYCKKEGPWKLIVSESHHDKCPDVPIQCSNEGCNEKIPRRSLASHNETCPKAIIPCEYNTVGCNKKMKREEQEKHNEESIKQHLEVAMKKIDALQSTKHVFQLTTYKEKKGDEDWYSPGFYTSPGGYKMSLRVHPNGLCTGKGTGTHVSCFMCLEIGEYDDTLEWPFRGEVTVELLNQLEDKNHKKETVSFNETTRDEPRQRVREGKSSRGLGIFKFISHEQLEYNPATNCQYLKDDSLYFRVSVKVTSKTKPWLVGASGIQKLNKENR
uniref:RING-type E3 ubiquitin transferase n=1 Tax=Amphimedon queenslandica TaxID=400682 RepID=A0A1X7V5S3_AMPQE